ncbi:30S ribosomal protein S4 [Candidatus Saccharibacteria bacterium]|jgi:small subunit ribosomal protein S4|nr:30S ribosomal protein S4 [Candidatus Saccharibacteria bacterium]
MARNLTSITKLSRREGVALHPKAQRIMVKRTNKPGQQPGQRQQRISNYGLQLREKQKAKRMYGLLEKQFKRLMDKATRHKGQTGVVLLELLERRLDNVIYRAGFAPSRPAARQLVSHGHFELNGRRVDIPSIQVKTGDEIVLRTKSHKSFYFKNLEQLMNNVPVDSYSWLTADDKKFTVKITGQPTRAEAEPEINEQLIVEYYQR